MTIGIDARMCGPQNGGLGRYMEQLIMHLLRNGSEHRFVLFLKKENWDILPSEVLNNERVQRVLADIPWYSVAEQIRFPGLIKKTGVDLMHFPHWNVPLFYRGPFVLTIHDLIMYHYPRASATTLGPVMYFFKDYVHRFVLRSAARRARRILVTSEFTKRDVFETIGVPLDKMVVTYQAPFALSEESGILNLESGGVDNLNSKFQIPNSPFVLYVGSAYPHKNLSRLLEAWKIFQEKNRTEFHLVLVTKDNEFFRRQSHILNSKFQIPNVIHLSNVSDTELVSLYKSASLYVFPSLYEGFGLPPLEAMSYGVPVVSSNRTCLPEVLGEAALYFDPENSAQMAEVMETGLRNEEIRRTLQENAKHELKRYSWQRLAEQTAAVYDRAMANT